MNEEVLKITKELGTWIDIPKDMEKLAYHIVMQAYHEGVASGLKKAIEIHDDIYNKKHEYMTEEQALEKARLDDSTPTKEVEIL